MLESASLCNQLLIAMPGMADPNFSSTVTLICEHNDEEALGIVINRPLLLTVGDVLKQLDLNESDSAAAAGAVLDGGPVGADRGFVLHGPGHTYENSILVSDDIHLTSTWENIDLSSYRRNAYHKSNLILRTLENILGEESMTLILRTFQQRRRFTTFY